MGVLLTLIVLKLKAQTSSEEFAACMDEPDRTAYMARRPGAPHTAERCEKVLRYGSREWVPELGKPTVADSGVRGKPGLEQQLMYVRAECRKLARQLKQRC